MKLTGDPTVVCTPGYIYFQKLNVIAYLFIGIMMEFHETKFNVVQCTSSVIISECTMPVTVMT